MHVNVPRASISSLADTFTGDGRIQPLSWRPYSSSGAAATPSPMSDPGEFACLNDPRGLAFLHQRLNAQQQQIDSAYAREASLQNQLDAIKNEFNSLVERFTDLRAKVDGRKSNFHRFAPNSLTDAIRSIFASSSPGASKNGDGKSETSPASAGPYCTANAKGYGNAFSYPTNFASPYLKSRSGFGWALGAMTASSIVNAVLIGCLFL